MSRTVRRTKNYRLFEGTLQALGCFSVMRLADDAVTYWNTGSEGREWANRMRRLSDAEFDLACSREQFHTGETK